MKIELDEVERFALLAMVGLAVAVMQNDTQNGPSFVEMLAAPEMQSVCKNVVEKLNAMVKQGVSLATGD